MGLVHPEQDLRTIRKSPMKIWISVFLEGKKSVAITEERGGARDPFSGSRWASYCLTPGHQAYHKGACRHWSRNCYSREKEPRGDRKAYVWDSDTPRD